MISETNLSPQLGQEQTFLLQHFKTSKWADCLDGNGATSRWAYILQAFIGSIYAGPHTHSHPLYSPVISNPDRQSSKCLLQLSLHSEWFHKSSPVQSGWTRSPKTLICLSRERVEWRVVAQVSSFSLSLCFYMSFLHFFFFSSSSPIYFQSSVMSVSVVLTGAISFKRLLWLMESKRLGGLVRKSPLQGQRSWCLGRELLLLCWMTYSLCAHVLTHWKNTTL